MYHWIGTICLWSLIYGGLCLFAFDSSDKDVHKLITPISVLLIINVINQILLIYRIEGCKNEKE